jgi:hypothetical protein
MLTQRRNFEKTISQTPSSQDFARCFGDRVMGDDDHRVAELAKSFGFRVQMPKVLTTFVTTLGPLGYRPNG